MREVRSITYGREDKLRAVVRTAAQHFFTGQVNGRNSVPPGASTVVDEGAAKEDYFYGAIRI